MLISILSQQIFEQNFSNYLNHNNMMHYHPYEQSHHYNGGNIVTRHQSEHINEQPPPYTGPAITDHY